MKIYNEITMKFNELTGEWDTLSEDSFEDHGPVSLARRRRRKRRRRGKMFKKLRKRLKVSKRAKRRIKKAVTPSRRRRRKIGRGLVKGLRRGIKAGRKIRKVARKVRKRVRPSRKIRRFARKVRKRVRPPKRVRRRVKKMFTRKKRRRSPAKRRTPRRRVTRKSRAVRKRRTVRKRVVRKSRPTRRPVARRRKRRIVRKPKRHIRRGRGLRPTRGKIRRGGRKAIRRRVGRTGGRRAARKGRGKSLAARLGLRIKRSAALKARRRRPKPRRKIVKRRAKPARMAMRMARFRRLRRKRIPRRRASKRKMRRSRGRPNIKKILKRIKKRGRPIRGGRRLSFPVRRPRPPRIPRWRPRGAPSNAIFLSRRVDGYGGRKDIRRDVMKWTEGYFNGDGTMEGNLVYTASFHKDKLIHELNTTSAEIALKNQNYYFNVCNKHPKSASSAVQFSVTFAHLAGSGSDTYGDSSNPNTLQGETETIYKQFANTLLMPEEFDMIDNGTDGFKISKQGSHSEGEGQLAGRDDYVWILVGKRSRMKDKMNKKAWTLRLKGIGAPAGDGQWTTKELYLTDDSRTKPYTPTPAGPRYNIVSGSSGYVSGSGAAYRNYGWFYPEMGVMVFSGHELKNSIPGPVASSDLNASFLFHHDINNAQNRLTDNKMNAVSTSCFTPNLAASGITNNALRFVNCMRGVGTSTVMRLRNELDRTQIQYFCRVKNNQMNHSNNPSFTSGSNKNQIRNKDMRGNPQTYITSVGLWNRRGQLLAIAKLSKPALKNFKTEATIKVQLEF